MQTSSLSNSEKAVGTVIALLSTYGAYQGAGASHQAELNRAKIDGWRVELDEHRTVREQMVKLLAADWGAEANVAQVAAQYELAALTLARLPKKDQTAYATVLVRSMEASLIELSIQRETLELKRNGGKHVPDVVAKLQRIAQASWQIGNVLAELRPKAHAQGQAGFQQPKSDHYRVVLYLCEQGKGATTARIKDANARLQALKRAVYPNNQTLWEVQPDSKLSAEEREALKDGSHVVTDPPEEGFATALAERLNDAQHGFATAPGHWRVSLQTGKQATPWYVSLRYCPAK